MDGTGVGVRRLLRQHLAKGKKEQSEATLGSVLHAVDCRQYSPKSASIAGGGESGDFFCNKGHVRLQQSFCCGAAYAFLQQGSCCKMLLQQESCCSCNNDLVAVMRPHDEQIKWLATRSTTHLGILLRLETCLE